MSQTNLITTSQHYVFHYASDSLAAKEIQTIIATQEASYAQIVALLKVTPDFKIDYYLLETPEAIGRAYGDNEPCNGFAREPHDIYAVYNEEVKCIGPHEDAHLLSYLIAIPPFVFIREGLAMYFDATWWGKPNEQWVKEFVVNNQYHPIGNLLDDDYFYAVDCAITYPIAGAFTHFLITALSKDRYLSLYREADFTLDHLKKVLACEDLDQMFIDWINKNN